MPFVNFDPLPFLQGGMSKELPYLEFILIPFRSWANSEYLLSSRFKMYEAAFSNSRFYGTMNPHMAHYIYIQIYRPFPIPHTVNGYTVSASFNKLNKSMLLGRSIGSPNARSQINCASGPIPRETPKVTV